MNKLTEKVKNDLRRRANAVHDAFQSKEAFIRFLETDESARGREMERNPWKNEDLDISPPEHWTWRWWNYAAFWWSYGFSSGVWTIGSSLVSIGLTSWQAVICIFVGSCIGSLGVVLHSRSAATYHFGFPVESRIPWGLRGAYWPVLVRVLTCTIWVGVTIAQTGYFLAVAIRAIFGESFWNIKNTIPSDQGITPQQVIGMMVAWVAFLPLLSVPLPKVRVLFTIKTVLVPPATLGLFIFCMVRGYKGANGIFNTNRYPLSGSVLAWTMLKGINTVIGKTSTLVINQPDIARYAHSRQSTVWSQAIAFPLGNTACACLGIFATSAIYNAWGVLLWNPWDLGNEILTREWNHGTRAWIAIVYLIQVLSNIAVNLGANLISWGADSMIFLPRFVNIKRGMYIAYCLGLVIVPWKILKSASSFLAFLGGYNIFLGPLLGIFITDYFVIRRGNVFIKDLYEVHGRYWYFMGVHWRPIVAYLLALVFMLPGFATVFGDSVPATWVDIYIISWPLTCVISSIVYFGLCMIGGFGKEERSMAFEQLYREGAVLDATTSSTNASNVEVDKVTPDKV